MYTDGTGQFAVGIFLAIAAIMLFTPVGGTVAQVATSVVSYAAMSVWAVGDLIFNNGQGAWADMNRINWNPFNSNEAAVLDSSNVSFYKGVPVFLKNSGRSGSFYAISLNKNQGVDALRYERGHNWQAMMMGIGSYGLAIGLPSVFMWGPWAAQGGNNYYRAPWEITADLLGGASRSAHTQADRTRGWWYLATSIAFFPAAYFFLIQ